MRDKKVRNRRHSKPGQKIVHHYKRTLSLGEEIWSWVHAYQDGKSCILIKDPKGFKHQVPIKAVAGLQGACCYPGCGCQSSGVSPGNVKGYIYRIIKGIDKRFIK